MQHTYMQQDVQQGALTFNIGTVTSLDAQTLTDKDNSHHDQHHKSNVPD